MTAIAIPGTEATLEVDEEVLANVDPEEMLKDLPELHPHSGENFGKPTLNGE